MCFEAVLLTQPIAVGDSSGGPFDLTQEWLAAALFSDLEDSVPMTDSQRELAIQAALRGRDTTSSGPISSSISPQDSSFNDLMPSSSQLDVARSEGDTGTTQRNSLVSSCTYPVNCSVLWLT